jgi:hypothetical protein
MSPGTGGAASPSAGASTTKQFLPPDPRADLPVVKAAKVGEISYAKASAERVKLFAPAAKASGGLTIDSSVTTVRVAGKDTGALAVYSLKPGQAKSPTFQDQYVVQLVNALTRSESEPRFVRVEGQVMALSTGSKAIAAWVSGDRVVLLYRQVGKTDLAALAAAVKAHPLKG